MRAIADELGIRAPSLYKHVADKETLEVALISDALAEIAAVFEHAVAGSDDPLGLGGRGLPRLGARPPAPVPADDGPAAPTRAPDAGRRGSRRGGRSSLRPAATPTQPERHSRSRTAWWCSSSTTASRPVPISTRPGNAASPRSGLLADTGQVAQRLDRRHRLDPVVHDERQHSGVRRRSRTRRARRRLRGRSAPGSRAEPGAVRPGSSRPERACPRTPASRRRC